MEFFLKWKGYSDAENSWEPMSNLNCSKLLKLYMIKHKLTNPGKNATSKTAKQAVKLTHIVTKKVQPKKSEASDKETRKMKHPPVKIALPRKRQAGSSLLSTKGRTGLKKLKVGNNKPAQKTLKPKNNTSRTESAPPYPTVPDHSNIRTQAQATPQHSSTSLVREQDQRFHVAVLGMDEATSTDCDNNNGSKDTDDDVVLLYVDPPTRPSITQPRNQGILPSNFSPTDAFFSIRSLSRTLPNPPIYIPTYLPVSVSNSLSLDVDGGLCHTDSDSSATLTDTSDSSVTLTGDSSCNSPVTSSPVSENSFNLQLSSSSTLSSSAGDSESSSKATVSDDSQGTSFSKFPCSSRLSQKTLADLPSDSPRTRLLPPQHILGTKPVLNAKSKEKVIGSRHVTKSNIGRRLNFPNRKRRMGPVPSRCQPVLHQSLSTSLQTKAARNSNGFLASSGKVLSPLQVRPKETNHFPKNDHVSVILKFNGMRKQVLVHKNNLFPSSDEGDTDSSTGMAEKHKPHYLTKKQVKSREPPTIYGSKKPLAHCNSVHEMVNNQLLLHKKVLSDKCSKSSHVNGLSLVHTDPLASNSDSLTNPLQLQPVEEVSNSRCLDPMPALISIESVQYKQILLDWQFQLNRQRGGTDDIIFVENEIDRSEPPKDFTYICSNIYGEGVPDPNLPQVRDSLCGCQCYHLGKRCGPKASYCCSRMADVPFAYTLAGKVCVTPGTPIYECNWKCCCPMDCINRVVQHGRKIPLCIFRTSNNRGWGVKTLQPIKANTFVTEYVGEVITSEEAERRGKGYDEEGETYLFDLDFDDDQMFTIDAKNYGNISHFFNHSVSVCWWGWHDRVLCVLHGIIDLRWVRVTPSLHIWVQFLAVPMQCDPNLVVYSVWIDTLDKRLPRIAFFTTKNISAGEELTFDYQMNLDQGRSTSSRRKITCRCGSKNCLQYIN